MPTKNQPLRPATLSELVAAGYRFDPSADAIPAAPAPAEEPTGAMRRIVQDGGISVLKGVIGVPEMAVGLVDLATGGYAGKAAEAAGFRPKDAKAYLDTQLTPETQAAMQKVQQADGFLGKVGTAIQNPSVIGTAVAESLPLMGAGGLVGRGIAAAVPRMSSLVAGAAGEGVVGAGSAAEQIRQESADGTLSAKQAGLAALSGAGTAAFGVAGGKMASKLGIGDVDTMIVQAGRKGAAGAADATQAALMAETKKGVTRRFLEGALSEGVLEELPQSVQEQVLQNAATGKPLEEGVDMAAALGMLSGMAMGGPAGALGGHSAKAKADQIRGEKLPEGGPMSRAVNAGIEQTASDVERGAAVPGITAEQEAQALTRMEGVMDADQKELKAQGRADKSQAPMPPALAGMRPGVQMAQGGQEAGSATVSDSPFADRVLELGQALSDDTTRAAIVDTFGQQGLTEALYYANLANRAGTGLPARTQDNLLAVAEAIVSRAVLKPLSTPAGIGSEVGPAAQALGATAPPAQIGLDTTPTGTIRVDAQGNAAPEVAADAISSRQRAQDAQTLGKQTPRGGPGQGPAPTLMAALQNNPTLTGALRVDSAGRAAPETLGDALQTQARNAERQALGTQAPRGKAQAQATPAPQPKAAPALENKPTPTGRLIAGQDGVRSETVVEVQARQRQAEADAAIGLTPDVRKARAQRLGPDADAAPSPAPTQAAQPIKKQADAREAAAKVGGKIKRVPNGWAVIAPAQSNGASSDEQGQAAQPRPAAAVQAAEQEGQDQDRKTAAGSGTAAPAAAGAAEVQADGVKPAPKSKRVAEAQKKRRIKQSSDSAQIEIEPTTEVALDRSEGPPDEVKPTPKSKKVAEVRARRKAKDSTANKVEETRGAPTSEVPNQSTEMPREDGSLAGTGLDEAPGEDEPTASDMSEQRANPSEKESAKANGRLDRKEPEPAAKIDDFGEKLPPARRAMSAALSQALSDEDIASQPLSQIWPAAENEAIEDDFAAAVAHSARAEIPAKPRVSYKVARWVEKVKGLRELAGRIVGGTISRERFIDEALKRSWLRDFISKVKLLEQIKREDWKRIGNVSERPDAYTFEAGKEVPKPMVSIEVDGKSHWLRGSGELQDHMDAIRALLGDGAPEQRIKFEIRTRLKTGKSFISKTGDKQQTPLMEFDSVADARKALAENYAEIVKAWDAIKDRTNVSERDVRSDENRPRAAKDWRNGKDVTPEQFQRELGFKGVEFGKWVGQGKGAQERQHMLNSTFDAMMDLAEIIGVPPKAMSLNGTLGLAFGSRGSGWASAHFEPSNLVINLTKPRGAGSLAHEWFHALDNYFARQRGGEKPFTGDNRAYRDSNYITHKPEPLWVSKSHRGATPISLARLEAWRKSSPDAKYLAAENWQVDPNHPQGVRPEVEARFADLVRVLDESPMSKRARTIDGVKESGDGYWSRTLERAARAFEGYVMSRMMEGGYHNDFLANVTPAEAFKRDPERYPYLLPNEVAPVAEAFGALFDVVQTRADEAGNVAMFSRSSPAVPRVMVELDAEGNPEYLGEDVDLRFPAVTQRVEQIEGPGQQILNFVVMPSGQFQALGYVEVLMEDGRPVSLLDMEVGRDHRGRGVGRQILTTLLAANPEQDLNISNIVPEARGFWERMGIPAQNVEGAYDGTLNWKTLAEATNARGARSADGASKAASGERDAGGASKDRGAMEALSGERSNRGGSQRDEELQRNQAEHVAWVESVAASITAKWANAPKVVVVYGLDDPKVPQAIRDEDSKLSSQDASGQAEGVYFKGVTYLNAGSLRDEANIRRVLFHEALGHYGLRRVYGKHLDGILEHMVRARPAEVLNKALEYGFNPRDKDDLLTAAEEVLAEMAQSRPELGFVRRAVAAIRTFMRSIGFKNLRLSDDEIIRNYILPARRFVEQGGPGGPKGGKPKFSRDGSKAQTQTPEFKRWFGDSKVVDAAGKPQVVYHGTVADFNAFDLGKIGAATGHRSAALGAFFTASPGIAQQFAGEHADETTWPRRMGYRSGSNVMPVFLTIKNPLRISAREFAARFVRGTELIEAYRDEGIRRGHDGVFIQGDASLGQQFGGDEYGSDAWVAFRPEQIKSAIGNNGQFEPTSSDIRFSRSTITEGLTERLNSARGMALPAGYLVDDFITSHGKLGWWQKTVGTPYALAKKSPAFKRVFDAVQRFLGDVSTFASEAADLAPQILPKLDKLADLKKSALSPADTKALSRPVFEGTLSWRRDEDGRAVRVAPDDTEPAGIVFNASELRDLFGLNDHQIGLYEEFRRATDESLRSMTVSEMIRLAGKDLPAGMAESLMDVPLQKAAGTILEALGDAVDEESSARRAATLSSSGERIQQLADRAESLQARGYAPLSRFGTYTLDVLDESGERVYFGLFESQAEANRMARKMRQAYPSARVAQGTLSQEAFKLFAGVSPETMEIFGELLGLDATGDEAKDAAFQEYIKRAKNTRSAMKRLIHRQGIAGFSEDAGRVLAGFIYSNARATSSNLHQGEISEHVQAIVDTKGQGELADYAVKLAEYVKNPQEEAQAIRGVMFAHFLGGSVASALVNMTQPMAVTFPFLSQFGGVRAAASQLTQAFKDVAAHAAKGTGTGDAALDAALKRAEEDGTVSPQEVFHLMAQAQGKGALQAGDGTRMGDALAKANNAKAKVMLAWGKLFGFAEQVNRRVTFIAAYRMAPEGVDPAEFARNAVTETQFTYNKGNKPQWARGTLGSLLFTFKQYSVNYIELIARMASSGREGRNAALLAVAVLALAGGADELPFMKDAEDLIDGVMQRLGYNFNSQNRRNEFLVGILGKDLAPFAAKGLTGIPGMPIDLSGRLGMGNLIPGTGLLTKKSNYTNDVIEIIGPTAKLAQGYFKGASSLADGEPGGALESVLPVAAANIVKGVQMATTGEYRDARGRKVLDVTMGEAIGKAAGFQPNSVAKVQEAAHDYDRSIATLRLEKQEITAEWAQALADKDADGVERARQRLATWNQNNPDTKIARPSPVLLRKKVAELHQDRATRLAKSAPKEMREKIKRDIAEAAN